MNLHSKDFSLKLKQGLAANINTTATTGVAVQGEPHYTTDTKDLYIFNGSTNDLIAGLSLKRTYIGSGTLTAGTTTTVTDANATASSKIMIESTSAAITVLGVYVSAKNSGNFVLTHLAAAGTETFDYIIVN